LSGRFLRLADELFPINKLLRKMKNIKTILFVVLMLTVTNLAFARLRVIVSTDFPVIPVTNSDPDDVQSMVRFLLYSNEFNIEGLIASAGSFSMSAEKKILWQSSINMLL